MSKTPLLAGVVGWPVEHSLSPLIHTIWAHRGGINGHYIPIAIPSDYENFSRAIDALRIVGFQGVNITIPHKEYALRYAANASDNALAAGAANMLTFNENEAYADNSDITGFLNALKAGVGKSFKPRTALVLGAGGAARGVCIALKSFGFSKILITNRTQEKAEKIAADMRLETMVWAARSDALLDADIVVNTTSLGMAGGAALDIDLAKLPAQAVVADIVYTPLQTPLLKKAKARGHEVIDGLSMLMHQAAPGFKNWFGGEGVVDRALRDALVGELKKRDRT